MFSDQVLEATVDCLVELTGGGAATEFAIGTGRVAIPLAARGVPVAWVELSADMLAVLRSKPEASGISAVEGDMAVTSVEGEFSSTTWSSTRSPASRPRTSWSHGGTARHSPVRASHTWACGVSRRRRRSGRLDDGLAHAVSLRSADRADRRAEVTRPRGATAAGATPFVAGGSAFVHGVVVTVSRPSVPSLTRHRCDLAPESQHPEEEHSDAVRAFAQLRRLGLGFMAVRHTNSAWSRVPHTSAHVRNRNRPGSRLQIRWGLRPRAAKNASGDRAGKTDRSKRARPDTRSGEGEPGPRRAAHLS